MSERTMRWLINGLLTLLALLTLFPLFWMVSVALMPTGASSNYPPPLLPAHPTFNHFHDLFAQQHMGRYFLNSLIVATSATLLALLLNAMAGYAFAKHRFRAAMRSTPCCWQDC